MRLVSGLLLLTFQVTGAPPVAYEQTTFGRATHHIRIAITNDEPQAVQLSGLGFRFVASKDGIAFPCEGDPGSERLPASLGPGESRESDRSVTCTTPLPGRYELDVRLRSRDRSDPSERSVGTTSIQIDPSTNAPVPLPTQPGLYAAATITPELNPREKARVVVALINGSRSNVSLGPQKVTVHPRRRGAKGASCPPETHELLFGGSLSPGRMQPLAQELSCTFVDGYYDVDIELATSDGPIRVATHAVRVAVIPIPMPSPGATRHAPGR